MKNQGRFLVITAGALWGFTGLFVRRLSELGLAPMEIAFIRMIVAVTVIGVYLLAGRRRDLIAVKRKDLPFFIGTGIVSLMLFNYFYFNSITYSTVAIAVCLLYTAPAFVVLLSAILFRERITPRKAVALAVIFGGCICASGVFGGEQALSPRGFLFGIGSGFCFGMFSIFSRVLLDRGYAAMTVAFFALAVGAVGTAFFVDVPAVIAAAATPEVLLYGVGLGVCCSFLPYLLYPTGLRHLETGEAAMLVTSEPLVAAMVSVVLLGEPLTFSVAAGIFLIIAGIVIINRAGKKRGPALSEISEESENR